MKRIFTFALALILALSLCACRKRNTDAAQPIEEPKKPTPAEVITAAMDANNGIESAHISVSFEFAMSRQSDGQEGTMLLTADNSAFYAQIEADFTKSPYVLKGTLRLRLSGDDSTAPQEVPFCLWQEDGAFYAAYAYDAGGNETWMGSRVNTEGLLSIGEDPDLSQVLEQYRTLLCDWAETFEETGKLTVNGEPATAYTAQIDGEMMRKWLETYKDENGEPMLTFTDELIKELPPIAVTIAIDANGMPVYQEIDAAAFVSKLLERIIYSQLAEEGESFALDTLLIKQTVSDVNAVGPIEIPEDIQIYDYSTAMPGISAFLGA